MDSLKPFFALLASAVFVRVIGQTGNVCHDLAQSVDVIPPRLGFKIGRFFYGRDKVAHARVGLLGLCRRSARPVSGKRRFPTVATAKLPELARLLGGKPRYAGPQGESAADAGMLDLDREIGAARCLAD